MTLETLKLTLNPGDADEREYDITMIDTVDLSSTKEAFSIAPPGLSAADNILLGISGMQADISINWAIHDDGTDKANGTHTSTVITVEEQIEYIEDNMQSPDFGASWQLNHETGGAFNSDEVFFESFDTTVLSLESPKWKQATMRLRRGKSIG
jgi:hypothetical protein